MSSNPSARIRVCVIEDDPTYRAKLQRLLESAAGFLCDGSFGDAETALPHVLRAKPDVVLLDWGLPGMSGGQCLAMLKGRVPEVRVVVLTGIRHNAVVFDALLGGADGFLDKEDLPPPRLLEELREAHAGGQPLSRRAPTGPRSLAPIPCQLRTTGAAHAPREPNRLAARTPAQQPGDCPRSRPLAAHRQHAHPQHLSEARGA